MKPTYLFSRVKKFFSKSKKKSKGNNFDLWDDTTPLSIKTKEEIMKDKNK